MSNPLLKKNRKTAKTMTLDLGEGDSLTVGILKPTVGDRLKVFEEGKAAGEVNEKGESPSPLMAARFAGRIIVKLVVLNDTPAFKMEEREDLLDMPYFEELAKEVGSAFGGDQEKVGNA